MKEFIDKLIERFEEYKDSHLIEHNSERLKHCKEVGHMACDGADCFLCVWDKAKEIANEFSKEYNNDFCEWKMFKANARLRHKNCMFSEDTVDPWKFNFCPYCGKKIKVVE